MKAPLPSPEPLPAISIIIPHLNQPELLAKCLARLQEQSFDMSRAEIIVVDNGSRTPPEAVTGAHPNVVLIHEPVPGPGPTRNRGVAAARAPILAFTDSDCLPDRDWVATILARFESDPALEILGGDMRIFVAVPGRPTPAEAYEMVYAFHQREHITRRQFSVTANLAMRRAVWDAVGEFGGIDIAEDVEWGQRATRLGHRTVYAADVVVHHPARRTMAQLHALWDRQLSQHYRMRGTGLAGQLRWALSVPAMAGSPIIEIPRILRSDRLSGLRERGLAFAGLAGIRLFRARRMVQVLFDREARSASMNWNRKEFQD
jgi:glycosyltransferase involved in cell wall biosynthesis